MANKLVQLAFWTIVLLLSVGLFFTGSYICFLIPGIFALFIILYISCAIQVRWESWRSGKWFYLVCSHRRGWNEFLVNNLIPALPEVVMPVWRNNLPEYSNHLVAAWIIGVSSGMKSPILVEVRLFTLRARSVHEKLLPFKPLGKRNPALSQLLRRVVQHDLGDKSRAELA